MYTELKGVKIKNGCFGDTPVTMNDLLENRVNLVYARNGGGKSSLARAFEEYHLHKDNPANEFDFTFIGPRVLPSGIENNIRVFNDTYIDTTVKGKTDGLDSIVMLGEVAEVDTLISEAEQRKDAERIPMEAAQIEITKLTDKNNSESVDYVRDHIISSLKQDGSYADRGRIIVNQGTKLTVNEKTVTSIIELGQNPDTHIEPEIKAMSLEDIKGYLKSQMEVLTASRGNSPVNWFETLPSFSFDPEEANAILSKYALSPNLSERENKILDMLKKPEFSRYLSESKTAIIASGVEFCPMCHHEITAEDRESLKDRLSIMLNEEANDHSKEINSCLSKANEIAVSLPTFPGKLYKEDLKALSEAQKEINEYLKVAQSALKNKLSNLYAESSDPSLDVARYTSLKESFKNAFIKVQRDAAAYDQSINPGKAAINRLNYINQYIAYMELEVDLATYLQRKQKLEDFRAEEVSHRTAIEPIDAEIRKLEARKDNIELAENYINTSLYQIFMDPDRLKFISGVNSLGKKIYKLVDKDGHNIVIKKSSSGEKNILALIYFFASLGKGKSDANKYRDPMLLVIDDPVSSFDEGNKAGVYSYLNTEISKVLNGNPDSKVIIFSHDWQTIKGVRSLADNYIEVDRKAKEVGYMILNKKGLRKVHTWDNDEYQKLLKNVYNYAFDLSENDEEALTIGNQMRRVFEKYSTFTYHCSIDKMLSNPYFEELSEKEKCFYNGVITRLVCNSTSHPSEGIDTSSTATLSFAPLELQKIARHMLYFIYKTNKQHLYAYLGAGRINAITTWVAIPEQQRLDKR